MTSGDHPTYQLRVAGHLDDRWSDWFGELTIARLGDGTCTLTGPVADQAQLHGILARLRDIGTPLLSLRTLDSEDGWRISGLPAGPARGRAAQRLGGC